MAAQPFWIRKRLEEMSADEWESLCDGCGKCCLHKIEDEDTQEIFYTRVACAYLDLESSRCSAYDQRKQVVPACICLRPEDVLQFSWLPQSCAYRLLAEGEPLPDWHPLVSGDSREMHEAGMSVRGWAVSERDVDEEDWPDHVIPLCNL